MTVSRRLAHAAALVGAVAVLGAVTAPALALHSAADRGGLPAGSTGDVLAVSTAVGLVAAVRAWRRLRPRGPRRAPGRWSAEFAGLGLLAPLAAGLPALALHTAAWLPADVATLPGLAPALWGCTLVVAVLAASGGRRAVHRWLTRGPGAAAERTPRAGERPDRTLVGAAP